MRSYPWITSRFAIVVAASALGISTLLSCAGGSEEVFDTVKDTVEDLTEDEKEFRPTCGVVGESLRESAEAKDGVFLSRASALALNVVSADPGTGPVVVKLLALESSGAASETALARLSELVSEGVYLFQRPEPCSVTTSVGVGISGQLVTPSGLDVAEQLVREGLAGSIAAAGTCGEELLASCYQSLLPSDS